MVTTDPISAGEIAAGAASFAAANLLGDTLSSMVRITSKDGASTYQTLQHLWSVSINDLRNDVARTYDSSSIKHLVDYEQLFPSVFAKYFDAVKEKGTDARSMEMNGLIDKLIEAQSKAFRDGKSKDRVDFYETGKLLEEAYEKYPDSNLRGMARAFLESYPERHKPGKYNVSNLKGYLVQKDETSRFFNTIPELDTELKNAMMLTETERHDLKLVLEPKNFDATLAAFQWEINIEEGLMYGLLAYSSDKGKYVTPSMHAKGDFALKARTGDDASQLAMVDFAADKRLDQMLGYLEKNGATAEQMRLAQNAINYTKQVRDLSANVLIQNDLSGNAASRSNQANDTVMGPQLQKPIMLARGQIIAKGGFERLETTMARIIQDIDTIEKGNPSKQGGFTPWNSKYSSFYDKDGTIVKELSPQDFYRFGQLYNDAEKLYSHCVDRSDKMPDNKFFKLDYVNLAAERMIAEERGYVDEVIQSISSGDTEVMQAVVDRINELHKNTRYLYDKSKGRSGYEHIEDTIDRVIEINSGGRNLNAKYGTTLPEDERESGAYSREQLNMTVRDVLKQDFIQRLNTGDRGAIQSLAEARPEVLADVAVKLNKEAVNKEKTENFEAIRRDTKGRGTEILKKLSKHLDIANDKTKNDVLTIGIMIGGKYDELTGGEVRPYKNSLSAFENLYKIAYASGERQLEELFHNQPDGSIKTNLKLNPPPQNDLNKQFYYALLQAVTDAPVNVLRNRVDHYLQRDDILKEDIQYRPDNAAVKPLTPINPRPTPDTSKVDFVGSMISLNHVAATNLSEFRESIDNVRKTITKEANPLRGRDGSVTDKADKGLQKVLAKYPKSYNVSKFVLKGGLITTALTAIGAGVNKINEFFADQAMPEGLLAHFSTGSAAALAGYSLYKVAEAGYEFGKNLHNRLTGIMSSIGATGVIGYGGVKLGQSSELIQQFVSDVLQNGIPYSNEMVGATTAFATTALAVKGMKELGKLLDSHDIDPKEVFTFKNAGASVALLGMMLVAYNIDSPSEREMDAKLRELGAIEETVRGNSSGPTEMYTMENSVAFASKMAVDKFLENRDISKSGGELALEEGFDMPLSKGNQMLIYSEGKEPILIVATKGDIVIHLPNESAFVGEKEGMADVLIIPKDRISELKIVDSEGKEISLAELAKRPGFGDAAPSTQVEKIIGAVETAISPEAAARLGGGK